jgi:hypothetical protein
MLREKTAVEMLLWNEGLEPSILDQSCNGPDARRLQGKSKTVQSLCNVVLVSTFFIALNLLSSKHLRQIHPTGFEGNKIKISSLAKPLQRSGKSLGP